MVSADTINADKYFHSKANCQATQRGGAGEVLAEAISLLRELEEGTRKVLFEGADLIEQIEDANRDMEANKYGREQGKMNPNEAGIVTVFNSFGTGFRTWGNRSAAFPSSTLPTNFINVRRTADILHESVEYSMLQFIDYPIDNGLIDSMRDYLFISLSTKLIRL